MGEKSQWAVRPLKCPEEDRPVDLLVEWKIQKGKKVLQSVCCNHPGLADYSGKECPVELCSKAFRQEKVTPCAGSYSKHPHAPDSSAGGETLRTSPGDRLFVRRSQNLQHFPRSVRREPRRTVAFLSPSSRLRRFRSGHLDETRLEESQAAHLAAIRNLSTYSSLPRYQRAVRDLDRVLEKMGGTSPARLGLANYQHRQLSPTRSADLLRAAEEPEKDPFHSFYQTRLWEGVEKAGPEQIGLSLNFLTQAIPAFALIGFLKKKFSKIRIFLGGGLVTSWVRGANRQNLFSGLVDDLIAGPGEAPLLAACGIREGISNSAPLRFRFPADPSISLSGVHPSLQRNPRMLLEQVSFLS